VPDRNLGGYLAKKLNRPMKLWQGTCIVHETFSERQIVDLKLRHPDAEFIAHPECEPAVLRHADFIGSTSALLAYVAKSKKKTLIVGTETGILHQMRKSAPDKELIAAPFEGEKNCRCNECPHMKLNSLTKLYLCLRDLKPSLEMDPDLIAKARKPLERMLSLG
jgi:quinolinate synthase